MLSCLSFYMENFVLSACKDMKIFRLFRVTTCRKKIYFCHVPTMSDIWRYPFYLKFNEMSKTFENNAQKALTMASGIKQHLSEVAHLGIKTEGLDKLEAEANKAIEMIKEVDALRQEASEKLQKANEQLADVKELAMGYRQTIKNNFPMEQWERFGISDKR